MGLASYDLFMFDLDGVFVTGALEHKTRVLGGYRLLRRLREMGKKVAVIGSGSNWSTPEYWHMLRSLGFPFELDQLWPSPRVAAMYLLDEVGRARCLVLGEEGLRVELERHGHRVVRDWREADAVVVGHTRFMSFRAFSNAVRAVNAGALFVAANKVRWYYTEDGPVLSPGAIVAAVEFQTRREAVVVGKPSPIHFTTVLNHNNVKPEKAVMVGDTVESDLKPCKAMGCATVLVTSVERRERQGLDGVDHVVGRVDEVVGLL